MISLDECFQAARSSHCRGPEGPTASARAVADTGMPHGSIPGGAKVARSRVRERVRLLAVAAVGTVVGVLVGYALVQMLLVR